MTTRRAPNASRPATTFLLACALVLACQYAAARLAPDPDRAAAPLVEVATGRRDNRSDLVSRTARDRITVLWSDDVENGTAGWTHRDHGWGVEPHFHTDTYMAFDGEHSWWCGSFEFDADGGYGNGWDDRLELPPVDMSGAAYPVLTFAHYFHSEPGSDVTYLQAVRGGALDDLNSGFDGLIPGGGWIDVGAYGYVLSDLDNPLQIRFQFVSDGTHSDEDGGFDSAGGAYMVDNIKVFDFYGGEILFFDGAEDGGLCNPNVQTLAGDFWHIVERPCAATSGSHVWWCGDDADTSHVPGRLDNWLVSPPVDISSLDAGTPCTLRYMLHAEVPTIDNDYWTVYASTDRGGSWYQLGAWWGDFGACSGWSQAGAEGLSITHLLPGGSFRALFRFLTTDDGCGPGTAGGAGITIDDVALVAGSSPVERTSWGRIKAVYRN